jgi:hypothetical protein
VQDTVGDDTRNGGGDHVAEEEPGEALANLIALVPASDSEQSSRDETGFGETEIVSTYVISGTLSGECIPEE